METIELLKNENDNLRWYIERYRELLKAYAEEQSQTQDKLNEATKLRAIAEQKIDNLLAGVIKPQSNNSISDNSDRLEHSVTMRYINEFNFDIWNTEDALSNTGYYYDISGTSIEQNRVPVKLTYKYK